MGNTFGNLLKMTTFGESHGNALGVVIDGCPSGLDFDLAFLQSEMDRRRPGSSSNVSQRNEADIAKVLSGVFEDKTLGTPIAIMIENQNMRSEDYASIKANPRVGHADDIWVKKFGVHDYRGGGRSSGRETASRVAAGAVAKMILRKLLPALQIQSYCSQVGPLRMDFPPTDLQKENLNQLLVSAREQGESFGAEITIRVLGTPMGLGQPVFHKLKSDLASAVMSVGATTSFEIGAGHSVKAAKGTEFHNNSSSEKYGGIRGGISTGEPIELRVCIKPTSSILDVAKKGRHDPCIGIRAAVVLESMVAFVLADHLLWRRIDQI